MAEIAEYAFSRQEKLLGNAAMEKLAAAHVAVFGLGGVGSFAAEAIARAGVGKITLVDHDTVSLSNINRQLPALHSTLGQYKSALMRRRILDINPHVQAEEKCVFFDASTLAQVDFSSFDFVLDCIDSVSSKVLLIQCAAEADAKIISAMGTGNKLDPSRFTVTDISKTSYCPLARVMRTRLRKAGIVHLPVVWSPEEPLRREGVPASISFVPPTAGLLMAAYAVKELIV